MERPITNRLSAFLPILTVLMLTIQLSSCYYDNEEEVYPDSGGCDTTNVTYSGSVAPVLQANCNACHSGNGPSAGIVTDNYTDLLTVVNSGQFKGAINHSSGYSAMPKNAPKLSDCNLSKINKWIDAGAPNN